MLEGMISALYSITTQGSKAGRSEKQDWTIESIEELISRGGYPICRITHLSVPDVSSELGR